MDAVGNGVGLPRVGRSGERCSRFPDRTFGAVVGYVSGAPVNGCFHSICRVPVRSLRVCLCLLNVYSMSVS